MLEASHLTLRHDGLTLLDDLSLTAACGELTLIIGPNGAGKSTLLSLLSGLRMPASGQIRLCGHDPYRLGARELARLRAVVEQAPGWQPGFSAAELVMMGGYLPAGRQADWRDAMRLMRCDALAERRLETLSGGERQRVHLARALLQLLCSDATQRLLLLDEPTAALDFGLADALMAQLRELAQTHRIGIVAVVHDLNLAGRHADRILLMKNGCGAAFGTPSEVMRKERLEAIYGVRLAELISQDEQLRAFVPLSGTDERD
ncbi:ABC transporter ATP-binding protein [Paludibacterium purpuratum]|uniref:Iron complex transport system ATP-binding protein n=1 Tax=Paludibacterium purpuratum TaxID=1144873 RepID=A0A4R7BBN7_9NEIS|nr:ABC transporter ATP-binding protein [Paludibacterium purpuratum]TDR82073.1 iron complex transport system ATP-binding protein [Paludibacterium purpuratum]